MPSFLSKVFGRKKDEKDPPRVEGRVSDASLLEGKFETLSPSAVNFPEAPNGKGQIKDGEKDKDTGFLLFRVKSRQPPPERSEKRVQVPQLSLRLPSQREVFEAEAEDQKSLADSVIGNRRLNPVETLTLIRACSQAITVRGLETLGIMHPHWYSASPDIQRRLITLFIQSLAPKSPVSTLSPTASPFVSAFESEISSARSPHDVAAVLRWGLRHLVLESDAFGKDDSWYQNFSKTERSSQFSSTAFSAQLPSQLPGPHLELLVATLEILSSLAAHAEANGVSGSKLSKLFGLWLLNAQRAEDKDDWFTFYARWERMGRILEHLFLCRIRDEASKSRMPTRLLELVQQYPYTQSSTHSLETDLLPRPRFSTRQYDALFVRIETDISEDSEKHRPHPLRLLAEAFNAEPSSNCNKNYAELWVSIKKAVADQTNPSPGGYPALSHIFADDTIRFLSLLPMEDDREPLSPPFNLLIPKKSNANGKRAVSDPIGSPSSPSTSQHTRPATDLAPSNQPSAITTDWAEFSTSGFFENNAPLAATLIGTDKGVTKPSNGRSRLRPVTPISIQVNGRKSLDGSRTTTSKVKQNGAKPVQLVSRASLVSHIHIDEAFIDFWADALPDPISADWPAFVICKLKGGANGLDLTLDDGKRVDWLVVEQVFKRPIGASGEANGTASEGGHAGESKRRPASPKLSVRSETALHSMRKRFSFLSSNGRVSVDKGMATGKGKGRTAGGQKVGELGEILKEEDEKEGTPKLGFTDKSAEVSGHGGDTSAIRGSVVGLGVSGLAAGAATLVTAPSARKSPYSESVVSPPANGSAADATATVPTHKALGEHTSASGATPNPEPVPTHESEPVQAEAPASVSEEGAAVAAKVEETQAAPAPTSTVESPIPDVVEPEATPIMDATVPPAQDMEKVAAFPAESEQGVESHATEEQEQADIPAVTIDCTPAAECEEAEAEVTINVETVEPVPFSETSSIASPVPAYAQPPVPVETLVHTEPLRMHEDDGAEDPDVVQDAVPVVEVEPIPVELTGAVPLLGELDSTTGDGANGLAQRADGADPAEPVIEVTVQTEENQEELPPAPESVVLSGETPGPALALSTSEPIAVAQAVAAAEREDNEQHHSKPNGSATSMDSHPAHPSPEVPVPATNPVVESETSDDLNPSPTSPASN